MKVCFNFVPRAQRCRFGNEWYNELCYTGIRGILAKKMSTVGITSCKLRPRVLDLQMWLSVVVFCKMRSRVCPTSE